LAKRNEVRYGKNDLVDNDLSPQEAKLKVTIYLDGDLLLEVRRQAKRAGKKYQTLINESLRDVFLAQRARIDPQEFQRLMERVAILEKAVASEQD
jgi:hypothetical protein